MNQNARAYRQFVACMLGRFLGNSAMFDCSPAKAALVGAAAILASLSSGEGILTGSGNF